MHDDDMGDREIAIGGDCNEVLGGLSQCNLRPSALCVSRDLRFATNFRAVVGSGNVRTVRLRVRVFISSNPGILKIKNKVSQGHAGKGEMKHVREPDDVFLPVAAQRDQ